MSTVQDIINAKVFLGYPKNKSNPKTRDHWLGVHNGMVVFNPEVVQTQIDAAKKMFQNVKTANKEILVICEKELYKEEVEALATKAGVHYLNHKVPAGVLTNFDTLLSNIKRLNTLRKYVESESFETLTKKEQSMKLRQLKKVELVYKGVKNLTKKPDLVIIVDGQYMHKFVAEVEKLSVPAVVLASSDFDKWIDAQLVMCNVNSYQSLDYVLKQIIS